MANIPLHYYLAEKVMNILEQGSRKLTYSDDYIDGKISQIQHQEKSMVFHQPIFIASADVYNDLSLSAIKLVIRIQQELEINNCFWECNDCDHRNIRAAIAQLKRKGIIERLTGTSIFYVNPLMIRKGKPLTVIGATYQYAKAQWLKDKKWKPTTEDIKRLSKPESIPVATLSLELDVL